MTDKLLLFAAFVFVMLLMSFNYTKKKRKIVFFGDSVNEQGIKPGGYISKIQSLINREGLDDKYALSGVDLAGKQVYDWYTQLEKEVLAQGADMVVICIGILNRTDNNLNTTGSAVNDVQHFYKEIIHKLTKANIKIVVCTPAANKFTSDNLNSINQRADNHGEFIRVLSKENDLKLVDLEEAFANYNRENIAPNNINELLFDDKFHLTDKGNEVIAEQMWKAIRDEQNSKG